MAYFRADCGVFAGSSVGNPLFSMGVWPTQGTWVSERRKIGCAKHLEVTCPVDGSTVNTAVTVFADDCGATTSAVSIEEAFWLDNLDDQSFDHLHALANLKQNHAKAVRQVDVRGPGSAAVQRAFANAGNQLGSKVFAAEARYLGPIPTHRQHIQ